MKKRKEVMMNFLMIAFILMLVLRLFGNKGTNTNEVKNTNKQEAQNTMHPAAMELR
jgi:large-conductance mechanosensitive channel